MNDANIDQTEIQKFDHRAGHWWDADGVSKSLHDINPLRLAFITRHAALGGKTVLDAGCGGGILSEAMAKVGAQVTGIDMSAKAIDAARNHLQGQDLEIDYQLATVEKMARQHPGAFDVVTCMELLEHVPDPQSVVHSCARLVRGGGHVFFATLNRNLQSYLFAIIGAEYILRLLPRGTHRWSKFITPEEMRAWGEGAGLHIAGQTGLQYNPFTRHYALGPNMRVNYFMCLTR